MTENTTTIEQLTEQLNDLRAQNRIDIAQLTDTLNKLREKNSKLMGEIEKRIATTRQNYSNLKSDDPSVGMKLTEQQKGTWEGRIEVWEYAKLIAQEIIGE